MVEANRQAFKMKWMQPRARHYRFKPNLAPYIISKAKTILAAFHTALGEVDQDSGCLANRLNTGMDYDDMDSILELILDEPCPFFVERYIEARGGLAQLADQEKKALAELELADDPGQ